MRIRFVLSSLRLDMEQDGHELLVHCMAICTVMNFAVTGWTNPADMSWMIRSPSAIRSVWCGSRYGVPSFR